MIRVTDDYVIDVDPLNYTAKIDLHKSTTDKDGNTRDSYKIIGYYTTLRGAVKSILDYDLKSKLSIGEKSLTEAIIAINEATNKMEHMLNTIIPEEDDLK